MKANMDSVGLVIIVYLLASPAFCQSGPPSGFAPIRVGCGRTTAYTDPSGLVWAADYGYGSTSTCVYSSAFTPGGNTNQGPLYLNGRITCSAQALTVQYSFAVPNGPYSVTLKFAEFYWTTYNTNRVFNIAINGVTVQTGLNLIGVAPAYTPVDEQFSVNVTSGNIAIALTPTAGSAILSGIDIEPRNTVAQSDVSGLAQALAGFVARGPVFATGRVGVIDSNGLLDGVVGTLGNCLYIDGTNGPCGLNFQFNETPSGAVNGTNQNFTLQYAPTNLLLFRNGVVQIGNGHDYTLVGTAITFAVAGTPVSGDTLSATYSH